VNRLRTDFGITGIVLDWISSYLRSRSQRIGVDDFITDAYPCLAGVPQGSVLGPLFFTAYVSPVGKRIEKFDINHHSYADDITLYVSLHSNSTVQSIEDCTSSIAHWFMVNDMMLNSSKSTVMTTGTKHQLACISFSSAQCSWCTNSTQ
jgi:ribonucleases P/MRP protein subunit RPP40